MKDTSRQTEFDVVVIGGGAAGLFCAITAGKRGRRVAVIEHNAQLGRKILISGGGRCNFTNRDVSADNFISHNPHFCRSALAGFTPQDFIAMVERHRIPYYEKRLGQLFCRDSSRAIVDMLVAECQRAGVTIFTNTSVTAIERNDLFNVTTAKRKLMARSLVIATGGASFSKIGATTFGDDVARRFGHEIVQTRPSLVGLVAAKRPDAKLAGISADAEVSCGDRSFRENVLCTHRGISGPAILQISNYWSPEKVVMIDLLPDESLDDIIAAGRDSPKQTATLLSAKLPAKLVAEIVPERIGRKLFAELRPDDIETLRQAVHQYSVVFRDTEGYDRAEVTLGGVSTDQLSSKTMESTIVNGLYFIGEVVDVTGWLGGYNFQWAWASGFAAGKDV